MGRYHGLVIIHLCADIERNGHFPTRKFQVSPEQHLRQVPPRTGIAVILPPITIAATLAKTGTRASECADPSKPSQAGAVTASPGVQMISLLRARPEVIIIIEQDI